MGRHPGDELQIVHRLQLGALLAVSVPDLALALQEGQPLEGEDRPEHIFTDPLGLRFCLGPDQAVDVEARLRPGEDATENGDGRED
jgi:hypothetical protein